MVFRLVRRRDVRKEGNRAGQDGPENGEAGGGGGARGKRNPDLTLKEHCEAFEEEAGIGVSEATMSRSTKRLPGEWPLKKSPE